MGKTNITQDQAKAMQDKVNNLAKSKNHVAVGGFNLLTTTKPIRKWLALLPQKKDLKVTIKWDILIVSFPVDPMPKPRMTQSDKWKKRKVTDRYWSYKHQLLEIAKGSDFVMPESNYHIVFNMPVPQNLSKKAKDKIIGTPHQLRPDKDNLEKGFLDALCKEDSTIWDGRITKLWSLKGSIDIYRI